jgi:hypothetical protein
MSTGYITWFTPVHPMLSGKWTRFRADAMRTLYSLAELQKAMDIGDTATFDPPLRQKHP